MAEVMRVSDLSVTFEGEKAVENISFSLQSGEALAIIGPNGAGKTVLLRALLGMVPYSGTITWPQSPRIGYVPQKIDADRHLPVNFQNLLESKASIMNLKSSDVQKAISIVGLSKKILQTSAGHLSGGEFQRALVAFALLGLVNDKSQKILLLDEPTASIDLPGEEQVYELIHRLQDEYGITVILVSHDLSFVYRYATKVLCLNRLGVCFGTPEEALTPTVLKNLYGPHKYYHHLSSSNHHA